MPNDDIRADDTKRQSISSKTDNNGTAGKRGAEAEAGTREDIQPRRPKRGGWKTAVIILVVVAVLICGTLAVRNMPVIGRGKTAASIQYDTEDSIEEDSTYGMETPANGSLKSASVRMVDGAAMPVPAAVYGSNAAPEASEKTIIHTVDITIGTKSFDDTMSAIRAACEACGGWVDYASEDSERDGHRTGYLNLRIPEDKRGAFDNDLASYGRIIRKSESASDVTENYRDNSARLETQKALMARLKKLMDDATELSDLISLENQMAETQDKIDSLQRTLDRTDREVAYSTVNVQVQEEGSAETADDKALGFGERVGAAIQVGLKAFTDFMQDMAVFLIYALPFILVAGVIALIVVLIVKKNRKK